MFIKNTLPSSECCFVSRLEAATQQRLYTLQYVTDYRQRVVKDKIERPNDLSLHLPIKSEEKHENSIDITFYRCIATVVKYIGRLSM
jgi:hypothetical protein